MFGIEQYNICFCVTLNISLAFVCLRRFTCLLTGKEMAECSKGSSFKHQLYLKRWSAVAINDKQLIVCGESIINCDVEM
jgi:hypothetical protein